MTKVKFSRKDGKFCAIECEGHTEYAEEGSDIVCAAISSVIQTAVLGIFQVAGVEADYTVDSQKGYLKAVLPQNLSEKQSHDAEVILKTAYLGASDLYETFSDFITLEVE
jgi:uncharacterized protein YsxB (DUF464 family)